MSRSGSLRRIIIPMKVGTGRYDRSLVNVVGCPHGSKKYERRPRWQITYRRAFRGLEHIVVLMLENRSFDHMLGCLKAKHPQVDGLDGTEAIPDSTGAKIPIQQLAEFRGQLLPDPHHDFASVDYQIYNGDTSATRTPTMDGLIPHLPEAAAAGRAILPSRGLCLQRGRHQ